MEINKKMFMGLNSKAALYYFGTEELIEKADSRIMHILNNIEEILDKVNQFEYLESIGVDNWDGYEVLDYE